MVSRKVLLVGLQSSSVDFSKWPELTRETLESAFVKVEEELRAAGFAPKWCLTDDGASAKKKLLGAIREFQPDVVSVGAGIRADPSHLRLFEDLVNLIHHECPRAVFAFNTDPMDTIASVHRAANSL